MYIKNLLLYCSILLFAGNLQSQNQINNPDLESWGATQLNYKHNKEWKFYFQEQVRFNQYSSSLDRLFTQIEAKYNLDKRTDFVVGFRHTLLNDHFGRVQEYENHFRYHIDALYSYGFDNYEFEYRLRYQNSNEMWKNELQGDYPNNNFRFRGSMTYKIKNWKLDPTGTFEMFYRRQIGALNGFDKYRLTLGSEYKINRQTKLNFSLIKEKQYRIWNPNKMFGVKVKLVYYLKRNEKN